MVVVVPESIRQRLNKGLFLLFISIDSPWPWMTYGYCQVELVVVVMVVLAGRVVVVMNESEHTGQRWKMLQG